MDLNPTSPLPIRHYTAAGGIVVHEGKVLVLNRPGRQEVRLPKGHIKKYETPAEAALREVEEESGYTQLRLGPGLGVQTVEFDYQREHIVRLEYYFLMALVGDGEKAVGESQFDPIWLSWEKACVQLTFSAEREWIRRAQEALRQHSPFP